MERKVTVYQLVDQTLQPNIIAETQPIEMELYQPVYSAIIKQNIYDQDLIYRLKDVPKLKTLPKAFGVGDMVQINERFYLVLPTKYLRLWHLEMD